MSLNIPNIFAMGQQAFDQSYGRANKMRQDRASVQAGQAISRGDYQGGAGALNQAGMLDQAHNVLADQQVLQDRAQAADDMHSESQIKQQAVRLAGLIKVAQGLKTVPMGQRAQVLAANADTFQKLGMDPSLFAGRSEADLSDENLNLFTGKAVQQLHFITQGPNTLAVNPETGKVEQTYKGPLIVKKDEQIYAPDEPGAAPPPAAPATAAPASADAVWGAIKQQESGGEAEPGKAVGPNTRYGNALGSTQMLPKTAQAMATKLGVPFRPDLLHSNTPEALAYQDKLGRAYFDEGVQNSGGDLASGAAYYFGGPDPKLHGPKTKAYVQDVMARAGAAGQGSATLQGGAGNDAVAPTGYHLLAQGASDPDEPPLSPESVAMVGAQYLRYGPDALKNLGQGKAGNRNKTMIQNWVSKTAQEAGTSNPELVARFAQNKANLDALRQNTKMLTAISASEHTLDANLDFAKTLAAKGVGPTGVPFLDTPINKLRAAAGSVDAKNYDNLLVTTANEYARVLATATGTGGQATVEGTREANRLINSGMTLRQLIGAINVAKTEAENRRKSYAGENTRLTGEISGVQPAVAPPKVRKYNPATGTLE